uniref:Putative choline kinase 3 n=1 Tax=Talaromyces marneffei PM1 TaxID=1077442 RepID=A0A093W277_TALMA
MGYGIPLIEAENMKFLAANSKVPVPKVHAAFRDPDTNKTYIIMEYLPGHTLEKLLPSLDPVEKATISNLIKDAITELRKGLDPKISGPFANQGDMNLAIIEKIRQTESDQYIRLLRNMIDRTLNSHRSVFTHGDLQPKNIMVERFGDRNVCPQFRISLLDWESAGWYPELWDFCNATIACRFKPDWLELVPDILEQYPVEFLMMQTNTFNNNTTKAVCHKDDRPLCCLTMSEPSSTSAYAPLYISDAVVMRVRIISPAEDTSVRDIGREEIAEPVYAVRCRPGFVAVSIQAMDSHNAAALPPQRPPDLAQAPQIIPPSKSRRQCLYGFLRIESVAAISMAPWLKCSIQR